MNLLNILNKGKQQITIFGTLPIAEDLVDHAKDITKLIIKRQNLRFTILYESDTDLFNKALIFNSDIEKKKTPYRILQSRLDRIRSLENHLYYSHEQEDKQAFKKNEKYNLYQINLPLPFYAILVDNALYLCHQLVRIPTISDYEKISPKKALFKHVKDLIEHYSNIEGAGIYLSKPDTPKDKMLVMYDRSDIPRGIYPRDSFYNTDFQRYSTWLLIFNRKGELLIHKRSDKAQDNGSLWDKSAGGHVDISDKSSAETAEKELIEELFLVKAEYTKHTKSDTSNLINLGEWNTDKRNKDECLKQVNSFGKDEFGYFFLKNPVKRTSKRRFIDEITLKPYFKETKFISDIFLFIAPEGEISNKDQLKSLSKYAAKGHDLVTIQELANRINKSKNENTAQDLYTDDLIFIVEEYEDLLIEFSDAVRFNFK